LVARIRFCPELGAAFPCVVKAINIMSRFHAAPSRGKLQTESRTQRIGSKRCWWLRRQRPKTQRGRLQLPPPEKLLPNVTLTSSLWYCCSRSTRANGCYGKQSPPALNQWTADRDIRSSASSSQRPRVGRAPCCTRSAPGYCRPTDRCCTRLA